MYVALCELNSSYNINWPNENRPLCKIRIYLLNISWAVASWTLVGASIDRFLCSSHSATYRRLSTSRLARLCVIGIFLFFALVFIETLYCFEASVPNVPVACYGQNLPCQLFNDWVSLSFDIVLPSIFLAVFGALTIRNARLRIVHPAINPINPNVTNNNTASIRNTDRNLTRMLFVQVSLLVLLNPNEQSLSLIQNLLLPSISRI